MSAALKIAFVAAIAAGVAGVLAYSLSPTSGGPSRIEITAASAQELRGKGIELLPPEEKPSVSKEVAASIAVSLRPGSRASETVLARLVISGIDEPIDTLVWAVSLDPTTIQNEFYGSGLYAEWEKENPGWVRATPETVYAISFIDARTGEELRYASQDHIRTPVRNPRPSAPAASPRR